MNTSFCSNATMLFCTTFLLLRTSITQLHLRCFKSRILDYIVHAMELGLSIRSKDFFGRLLFVAILFVSCKTVYAIGAANTSAANNTADNTTAVSEKPDVIILKSPACSLRGTFFTGVRNRYICADNSVVSEAVYTTQNNAAQAARAVTLAQQFFNNQSDGNRTNTSSLNNFTYLAEFGSSLINATSFSPPCIISKYNLTYCACPHE